MGNIKDRERFERIDKMIWKKTKIDAKGRCVLPKKLRQKLGLNGHRSILWISICKKAGKANEFTIELGVKN
jgi:bifunctional DNA-binding transcriptional regulator/antitoxin component of YhaV-PrlF toxin-antitoxin module